MGLNENVSNKNAEGTMSQNLTCKPTVRYVN